MVDLDAARGEGRKAERDRVAAIRQQCELAGCPERLGEFLDSDLTPEQVGKKILDERAENPGTEIDGKPKATSTRRIDARSIHERWSDPEALRKPAPAS